MRRGGWPFRTWAIGVPFWALVFLPTLLLAASAMISGRTFRRHRRLSRGLCLTCGYNLTGNTSGVCPECGTPMAAEAKE